MNEGEKRMTEKYTPADGEPIPMSQFTLGERYGSEDMYREWHQAADKWNAAIQPGAKIAYTRSDGTIWTDTVSSVSYTSPESEIWPHRTVWQRMVRRLTPKRFRKPLQPIRPYKAATVTVSTGDAGEDVVGRAQAQLGKTLAWIEGLKR